MTKGNNYFSPSWMIFCQVSWNHLRQPNYVTNLLKLNHKLLVLLALCMRRKMPLGSLGQKPKRIFYILNHTWYHPSISGPLSNLLSLLDQEPHWPFQHILRLLWLRLLVVRLMWHLTKMFLHQGKDILRLDKVFFWPQWFWQSCLILCFR